MASPLCTFLLLLALAAYTVWSSLHTGRLRAAEHPNRVALYGVTLLFEWFLFALVAIGVRGRETTLGTLVGERWSSFRAAVRDIAVAAGFWLASIVLLGIFGFLLGLRGVDRNLSYLLPSGPLEMGLWIVLSMSAGICEETVFRGLLQRQFALWTGNATAGLVLSAAAFGAGHAYQGWRRAVLIGLYGCMFGILARWRRSLRPGMMAHAWQDSVSGIVGSVLQRSLR